MVRLLQILKGSWRALGRPPKQSPILFQLAFSIVFGQPRREEW